MSVLKYPAPGLRKKSVPVEKIGEDVFKLVESMVETMIVEDGIGLAANQVGSEYQIFVMNTTRGDEAPQPLVFINPVVLQQEGEIIDEEGCLSFPDLYLKIPRPESVQVHAKSLYNEDFVLELTGLLARAVMHEMDHLNGVLIIDHASAVEKEKIEKYLEESKKGMEVNRSI
ncbi:MAG: peptide deformylase [candidate division WOR-3 bacterium]|nr:MAG: peptide deformylase [candidate division WOR-3 bacterium]